MKHYVVMLLALLLFAGCIKEPAYSDGFHKRMMVEGRIENDGSAVVSLSINTKYQGEYDKSDFSDIIVRSAKVTVECDGVSEVLVGRSTSFYPTQYIYKGVDIEGEVGKSYKLTVEYRGMVWQAETTIPEPASLSDISVERVGDAGYNIMATLAPTKTPCCIECSIDFSPYYATTILGVYDASDKPRRISINPPLQSFDYMPLFVEGQYVSLRLSSTDEFGYNYWSMWNNNVINNANPLFPMVDNLPTNISNNGAGIWGGYGSVYYSIGEIK